MWVRSDLTKLSSFDVRVVVGSPILIVNQHAGKRSKEYRLLSLNLMSGETLWDAGISTGKTLGAYPIPTENLLVIAVELPGESGVKSGTYLVGRKLDSGEEVWRTRINGRGDLPLHLSDSPGSKVKDLSGHPQPLIIDNTFILVAGDLFAIDLASGVQKWRFPLKAAVRDLKQTYAQPILVDGVLYAAGRSAVYAIDPQTGTQKWRAKIRKAAMPQLEMVGDLLIGRMGGTFSTGKALVGGAPYGAFAVDSRTGKLLWKWSSARDSITNLHIIPDKGLVLLADKKRLYALEIEAGKRGAVAYRNDLEFKRKLGAADVSAKGIGVLGGFLGGGGINLGGGSDRGDPPLDIESYGDRLIIRAQYHVLAHNLNTRETDWSIEFAPPGMSGLSLIAMGAITATMAVSNARQAGSLSNYVTGNSGMIRTSAFSSQFEDAVAERYAASEKARNIAFFLTKQKDDLSLVGINLVDGSVVGTITMTETEPEFMIDAIASRVYYFRHKVELLAYDF
jgi:outer membrane protein assembly factor BamB